LVLPEIDSAHMNDTLNAQFNRRQGLSGGHLLNSDNYPVEFKT